MKITFIKPNIGRMEHSLYVDEGRMEPLQLGVLAGLTPPDVECVLYDDRMEEIPYDEPTDLVAITVEIYTARRAYEIAAEYRQRGVPVIMGGFHPTLAPEECLEHADSIFIGDAESLWAEAVEDARRGGCGACTARGPACRSREVSSPAATSSAAKATCPSRSCSSAAAAASLAISARSVSFFDRTQFVRQTREVLDEIECQDRRIIFFVDDNFLSNHEAAKLFLRELIPLRIRWVSQASIDMTGDPELMELLEDSGCLGNVIGFESLNPANLRAMRKAPNLMRNGRWDAYQAQVRDPARPSPADLGRLHARPRRRHAGVHPRDVRFRHGRTSSASPPSTSSCPIRPRRSTTGSTREGRLLWDGKWWLHPEYRFNHAAFRPRNMTPDELTAACWDCRDRWNRASSIFERLWDWKTHLSSLTRLGVYLQYNPIYAKEAYKKQGMFFGLFRDSIDTRQRAPLPRLQAEGERRVV